MAYTGVKDMFDGGGPGASGNDFAGGGLVSEVANRAGFEPRGSDGSDSFRSGGDDDGGGFNFGGAVKGGRTGMRLGGALGPAGMIAGAAIGALSGSGILSGISKGQIGTKETKTKVAFKSSYNNIEHRRAKWTNMRAQGRRFNEMLMNSPSTMMKPIKSWVKGIGNVEDFAISSLMSIMAIISLGDFNPSSTNIEPEASPDNPLPSPSERTGGINRIERQQNAENGENTV